MSSVFLPSINPCTSLPSCQALSHSLLKEHSSFPLYFLNNLASQIFESLPVLFSKPLPLPQPWLSPHLHLLSTPPLCFEVTYFTVLLHLQAPIFYPSPLLSLSLIKSATGAHWDFQSFDTSIFYQLSSDFNSLYHQPRSIPQNMLYPLLPYLSHSLYLHVNSHLCVIFTKTFSVSTAGLLSPAKENHTPFRCASLLILASSTSCNSLSSLNSTILPWLTL